MVPLVVEEPVQETSQELHVIVGAADRHSRFLT